MMTANKTLRELLEKERISYQVLEHDVAFTALEVAQAQHLPGRQVVKSVVVKADEQLILCVLQSTHKIDFDKLRQALNVKEVHLLEEAQLAKLFPDIELGAMPPFGQLAGLKTLIDKALEENESIAFNAGTHTDMLRIKLKDFVNLAKPTFIDFGTHI